MKRAKQTAAAKTQTIKRVDARRHSKWLEVNWERMIDADENDGGNNVKSAGRLRHNANAAARVRTEATKVQKRRTDAEQRAICEKQLLLSIRSCTSLVEAQQIAERNARHLHRFGLFFRSLNVRAWRPSELAAFVRRLVNSANFRRAPLRSALCKSFVHLCMAYRTELGETLINVLIARRPTAAMVGKLFGNRTFNTADFTLILRWCRETPYKLPFNAFFSPNPFDAAEFSRVFASMVRCERLAFNANALSSRFVDTVLSSASDADFLSLAYHYMAHKRSFTWFLLDPPIVWVPNQFILSTDLTMRNRQRYEHLVILDTLIVLVPLELPVYVCVELLSWLSPKLGGSFKHWVVYADMATRLLSAYRRRSAAQIKTLHEAKCSKNS